MDSALEQACALGPLCPPPERIAATAWASHLPFAFWVTDVLRPRIFVELGTYTGVSFGAFCQAMVDSGNACEAYAVDLWHGDGHMGTYGEDIYADLGAHVRKHYGHFATLLRMSFDEALAQFGQGCIDLLHLDGCHTQEAILHDFESWLPKMSSRGVVLIHDICTRLRGYGGPAAWEAIQGRFATFTFRHGYGLGVVVLGQEAPAALKAMAALDEADQDRLAAKFQAQGRIYERLMLQEEQWQQRLAQINHARADLEAQLGTQERLLQEQRQHARRREYELGEALREAELRVHAYADSLSWKLTAPLRRLATLWRSFA